MSGASDMWGIARSSARAHVPDLVGTALVLGAAGSVVSLTGVLVGSGLRAGPGGDGGALAALASSFAGIALVVVLMVVTSTVGLAMRQRRRQIALLRTVGATAEQVRRLVSFEVVLVALASVPLGAVAGLWLARPLTPLLVDAGMVTSGAPVLLTPWPVLVATALLVPTAMVAGRLAARESARTSPSSAIRSSVVESHDLGPVRRISAVVLAISGLSAALSPLLVPGVLGAASAATSAFLLVGAAACAGPALVHAAFGSAARSALTGGRGTARLALSNVHGYSRRLTAVVVPLALVVATGTVSSSVDRTLERAAHDQLSDALGGDLVASPSGPVDPRDLARLADAPAVVAAASLGSVSGSVRTDPDDDLPDALVWEAVGLRVVDPTTPPALFDPQVTRGSLAGLGDADTVAIGADAAFELDLTVGDRAGLRLGGEDLRATVVAVYERGLGVGQYLVGPATPAAHGVEAPIDTILLRGAPGSATEARDAVAGTLGPGMTLQSTRAWVASATSPEAAAQRLSSVLLLALLLFVALGAGNAVALSTRNRRDELSLLARTGATRRQLLRMVATEGLLTAGLAWLVGSLAVLPAVLAVSFALLGPVVPAVAWVTYGALSAGVLLISVGAGVLAAVAITQDHPTPVRRWRAAGRATTSPAPRRLGSCRLQDGTTVITAQTDPYVRVRGAAEHNLRDVDVDLPRNAIVVFTGVSGSGKSSLAFDTVYAEAQRRYFESVAPYARRLLQQIDTPQVQEITGLPPAVALRQQRGGVSSRSTVGTITTLSNLLRMLLSRAGTYPDGAPRLAADAFSPNTVAGACPACDGLGVVHDVAEDLLVPDVTLTIREGAIAAWPGAWQGHNLRRVTKNLGIDVDTPWRELTREHRTWLLFTDERPSVLIRPRDKDGGGGRDYMGTFRSARSHVQQVLATSGSQKSREQMLAFMQTSPCFTCGGAGLRPEALAVTFGGRSIAELGAMTLTELADHLRPASAGDDVASRLSLDLVTRLDVLLRLGVGYLSLRRSSTTLSSGEAQRLRIATQLRAGLFGVAYVLDEPSAGLHPAETEPLLDVLEQLKAGGNSVFVVEHNLDVIRRADWIVEVGPGAGAEGGRIVYSGPLAGLESVTESPTSRHLFGRALRLEAASRTPSGWLEMSGVAVHNLQHVDVRLPVGGLTAITGVSGAGKSTLLIDVLGESVRRHLGEPASATEGALGDLTGLEAFDRLVVVDQRPIGRTPRSNVATYVGLFDTVRKLFAETAEARRRGYGAGRFSSNVAGGRCEVCRGEGVQNVELLFLPGVSTPCSACHGARYNDETLEVTLRGHTVADVLAMSVDDALEVFEDVTTISRRLRALHDVRLGYLRLGQTAMEVSGGEAQRIKLASELQRAHRGHGLYLLDEPTTGLHASDAAVLMRQLHELADSGNTVVVVEHDLDVVESTDWIIDLGPGGGDEGGRVVASGTPREVAEAGVGATAHHLRQAMRGL